jgi:hypothetical protein
MQLTLTNTEQAALTRYNDATDDLAAEMRRSSRVPSATTQAARLHRWWAQILILQAAGGQEPSAEFSAVLENLLANFVHERTGFLLSLARAVDAEVPMPEDDQGIVRLGGTTLGRVGFAPERLLTTSD